MRSQLTRVEKLRSTTPTACGTCRKRGYSVTFVGLPPKPGIEDPPWVRHTDTPDGPCSECGREPAGIVFKGLPLREPTAV